MNPLEEYSLVWHECGSDLADRFWVPGYDGFLPFLISGEQLTSLQSGEKVDLTEFQLLSGILYGLDEFDNNRKAFHRTEDRRTLTYLLDVLRNGYQQPDPELLLLDAAASVRERNGSVVSRKMLHTSLKLIPFSSKIRSDLICDTFVVASDQDSIELLEAVPGWVRETMLSELIPQAREIICYYGLCALIKTEAEDAEITDYLSEFIYPNVELRTLKNKIKSLLENPESFSITDLKLN